MTEKLRMYSRLLLETGVALKKDQPLLISSDVENAEFVHVLTEEAYFLGASEVTVNWRDGFTLKSKLKHASKEALEQVKPWVPEYYHNHLDANTAFISLVSADPKLLEGIPAERISVNSKAMSKAIRFYHEAIMKSDNTWCVAAVATELWADLLHITGTKEEKVNILWDIILKLCRLQDVSKEENFSSHLHRLADRTTALNELQLVSLTYSCPNGTNLTVEMPQGHLWQGGSEEATDGTIFTANIPTEEVFSAPLRTGVNGVVYSTKPLVYHGNTIDNFSLTFKEGQVISYTAQTGKEVLQELLSTDETSSYLGEIALVDHYSPISLSDKIYFETLFDENASCHLAFGAAYATCLKNGTTYNEEELMEHGLNQSLTHVDFMIGHQDMSIIGITNTGGKVVVMENGRLLV